MTDFSAVKEIIKISPEAYVNLIKSDKICFHADFTLSSECIRCAGKLLCGRPPFGKVLAVQGLCSFFSEGMTGFSVEFPLYLKEKAYMLDSGKMCFSRAFIAFSSGKRVFKVAMHEIAHMLLTECEDYGDLLLYNKQFVAEYGEKSVAVSPVEYCATLLSCELMRQFRGRVSEATEEKLLTLIQSEKEKVYALAHILS